jgi:hypothetical protein
MHSYINIFLNLFKLYFEKLKIKYLIILRNANSMEEKIVCKFSFAKFYILIGLLFIVQFYLCLILAGNVMSKWLNTAHMEENNRKKITSLISNINELEIRVNQQENYIILIQQIIQGKEVSVKQNIETLKHQNTHNIYETDKFSFLIPKIKPFDTFDTHKTLLKN